MKVRIAPSVAGILLVTCLSGCGSGDHEVRIIGGALTAPSDLRVRLDICHAQDKLTYTVTEATTVVTVRVTARGPLGGDQCQSGVAVRLSSPLGRRVVIDGQNGKQVSLDRQTSG